MNFPENIKYHREHTWIEVQGQTGVIGITEFAQKELGEIVYVDLPNIGTNLDADEVFGSVEAIKTVSDLFMPVGGKVLEINEDLSNEPTLVNTEPFGGGWMIKIHIANEEEVNELLTYEQYRNVVL